MDEIRKDLIKIVHGNLKQDEGTVNAPIGRNPKDRKKMCVTYQNSKNAVTHYSVINDYVGYSHVSLKLETGRTHQIRVHMAEIGYPIVGDAVYSNGRNPFGVEGQMLHSQRLEFVHPISGKEMNLEAPLPEYFEEVLKVLRGE